MLYWSSRSCSWTWNDPACLLFMAWSCFSLTFPSPGWHLFCFSFFLVEMNEQDIRYRDILGHGNGGTVYKWVVEGGGFHRKSVPKKFKFHGVFGVLAFWGVGGALLLCGKRKKYINFWSVSGCFIPVLDLFWVTRVFTSGIWDVLEHQGLACRVWNSCWEWQQWDVVAPVPCPPLPLQNPSPPSCCLSLPPSLTNSPKFWHRSSCSAARVDFNAVKIKTAQGRLFLIEKTPSHASCKVWTPECNIWDLIVCSGVWKIFQWELRNPYFVRKPWGSNKGFLQRAIYHIQ